MRATLARERLDAVAALRALARAEERGLDHRELSLERGRIHLMAGNLDALGGCLETLGEDPAPLPRALATARSLLG